MRRGETASAALSVSPQVTVLKLLREDFRRTPWPTELLAHPDVASVNPKINVSQLDDESLVSFIPMEAVEEHTNKFVPINRPFGEVRKGYTAFANGDLIWAKITPCMQNGKSTVVHDLTNGVGYGSTEFHVLRASDRALSGYLWALLSMPSLLYAAQAAFTGSSGHQRVPASFFESLEIPLPPLDVQRRLVSELDAARTERDLALSESARLLSSIDAMVKEKLDLPDFPISKSGGYAIRLATAKSGSSLSADYFHPERMRALNAIWRLRHAPLSKLVAFKRDGFKSPGDARYIGLASVASDTGQLTDATETAAGQCFTFEPGDVLYGRLRPYLNKVWLAEFSGVCSTEFHVMRPLDKQTLKPEYLAVVMRTSLIVAQTKHMMTGNTHPRIANEDVVNLLVPLTDAEMQDLIVNETLSRQAESVRLRNHAETVWREARVHFEQQLLKGNAA